MSCYACGASFGRFSKEHGCKNCGFAFCSKCLSKKTEVPKLNNEKHHVCNKCYNIITGKIKPSEEKVRLSPPEAYKKRIAALEEKEAQNLGNGAGKQKTTTKVNSKYSSLSKPEREIAERLEKLKKKTPEEEAGAKVSEKELNARLARLKGENPDVRTSETKPVYKPPDRRTQQAQIDDLLDEIANDVDLESRLPDPVKQVEERLARLKDNKLDRGKQGDTANNLNRSDSQESKPFRQNIERDKSKRTNEEGEVTIDELNKLIEEAGKELELDAEKALDDLQKDKEIMKRLQEIKSRKNEDVNKQEGKSKDEEPDADHSDSDNETEEQATQKLITRLLEEDKLDEAAAKDGIDVNKLGISKTKASTAQKEDYDEDELPYCSLCTEDATLRCYGCDRDLYCNRCWKESHVNFQMEDHVTAKYIKPKDWT